MSEASSTSVYPLSGLRILDVGTSVACALSTRYLARLGAEVVKVEYPDGGDPTRRMGPHLSGSTRGETGALHLFVNEGKRSVTLNITTATGREILGRLVSLSDAVVAGRSGLPAEHWDFDWLKTKNPNLVLVTISPFGDSGPYRNYLGSELTVFAMGGHMYRSGVVGRPPIRMGGFPSEVLGSLLASFTTLIALRSAREIGRGKQVEFSLFENQVTSHAQAMVEVSYLGEETGANAPRIPNEGRRLLARDGPVMFSVMEQQLPLLAELVGAPLELAKPRPGERVGSNPDLQRIVSAWVESRTQREVYEAGQAGHVPTSYTASPRDLIESPQYGARGFMLDLAHPLAGELKVPGLPFQWMQPTPPARPAPLLGQDTEEVLTSLLGFRSSEVLRLFKAGVI